LGRDGFGQCSGYGKTDPLPARHDGGIYADDLTLQVDERPAAVARVDRRIGLEEVVIGTGADSPAGSTDDPLGDRLFQADWELTQADKSLIVIEVELPLLRSQQYVTKAQGYLDAKNAKKADEALQIAERRAMALTAAMNSPLFLAKQNLWLAFRNYSTARGVETKTHLERARSYLGMTASGASTLEKEEADKLAHEIADLEKKLPDEGKATESALKMAFEKCEALAERSAAYLSADLSKAETTLGGESNLIEAKLHMAYAETYQVTTGEPDKAVKELDMAHYFLQKALASSLAGPADRKIMVDIDRLLLDLKATPEKHGTDVQERYDMAVEQLNDLIQEM